MRFLILCSLAFFVPSLFAETQIYTTYDKQEAIRDELAHIYETLQDKKFTLLKSSPIATDLKTQYIVIVSSAPNLKYLFTLIDGVPWYVKLSS